LLRRLGSLRAVCQSFIGIFVGMNKLTVSIIFLIIAVSSAGALYFVQREDISSVVDEETLNFKEEMSLSAVKNLEGKIIFDSNRSGTFGIYVVDTDRKNLRALADTEAHEMNPSASPDGKWVIYGSAKSTERYDPSSSIWIVSRDGTNAKQLTTRGNFPSFSADGKNIYYEVEGTAIYRAKFDAEKKLTTDEELVFPKENSQFKGRYTVKPRISPDQKYLAFFSDQGGRWTAWYVELATGVAKRIGKGCEPNWFSKSQNLVWVNTANVKDRSGLLKFSQADNQTSVLADDDAPWGHEYFPSLGQNDQFILYGACGSDGHSHIDSNYQIFVKNLVTGERARLTFDNYTNRWPSILPPVVNQ
jgi:Tol biopolymer transport system component